MAKARKDKEMSVPKIKGLQPCGMSVLVELLNEEEILGTTLHLVGQKVSGGKIDGAPQAYVLAMGPKVNTEEWGFGVGDRVMFSGSFVPAPDYDKHPRARGTIDPFAVKAVLKENGVS